MRGQNNFVELASIDYRRATPEDVPTIWRVRTKSIRELCKSHYSASDVEAWATAPIPDGFAELVQSRDFLVAEVEGTMVAFGFVHRRAGELEALFVSPDFARRGVGTAILQRLENIALEAGLESLKLSASLNSVAFYAAAGYKTAGETSWQHPAGFRLACVGMTKHLERRS